MDNPVEQGNAPPAVGTSDKQGSWLVRVSVSNPYLVIVLCLFIVVIGYVCVTRVPVDILPSYKTPAVQVLTLYPGMPTEFMDRTITNRIERWTGQAVDIECQESRTMIGVSVVRDHFSEGTDPNVAFAQVASLASSDLYYLPPGTVPPMVMLYDPTAPLPTAYLAASSDVLDETKVYELAYFNVRNMLSGTPGVVAPAVFGGKLRRIYGELEPQELHARNLSFMDVQRALAQGSPMIPPGRLKLGDEPSLPAHLRNKDVLLSINNMPDKAGELNQVPIKAGQNGQDSLRQQVDLKAVGGIADRAAIQTNLVRITRAPAWEGKQTVYIPIMRRPGSNTIEVVDGVKKSIPSFLDRLPAQKDDKGNDLPDSGLKLDVVADQSVFVRNAVNSLLWEGVLGAVLASLMVLIFIGSIRSTVIIALTIPLAALVAVIGLYFTGNTLNLMTLGGPALVMGRLVDDPIVDIENTFRHLDMGKSPIQAALDSAREIAMPVLVATITTVVVFFPVVFLYGMGKYLFQPLALCVAFAMFASYFLSRTLSPAFCAYFLKAHRPDEKRFWLFRICDAGYERLSNAYTWLLGRAMRARWLVVPASLLLLAASFLLYPFIGQELFPITDANQISINVRLPAGTRIEKTQERISGEISADKLDAMLSEPIEQSGLLNRALGVLDSLRSRGRFSPAQRVSNAFSQFHAATDPLSVWLDRSTTEGCSLYIPKRSMIAAFSEHCEKNGRSLMSEKSFGAALKRLRPDVTDKQRTVGGKVQCCYLGIGLTSELHRADNSTASQDCLEPQTDSLGSRDHPSLNLSHGKSISEETENVFSKTTKKEDRVNPVNGDCDHEYVEETFDDRIRTSCRRCGKFYGFRPVELEPSQ